MGPRAGEGSKYVLPLTVTNGNNTATVAFKLKTNAPQRYAVKPVVGIIPPGGTMSVNGESGNDSATLADEEKSSQVGLDVAGGGHARGQVPGAQHHH